jgi:tetratricopeptide (TPR) repeat protein
MKSATIFLLTTMLVSIAAPAWADDDAQSRAYFETGAKAYEKGDYVNAIRAFEQAYALTKRPGLIFSIAQSYKRQYAIDSNPAHLRKSLEYYRRFLTEDKGGKRRGDATNSIMEVEAILGRLPAEQQAPPTQTVETPQPTLVSITTQVDDATISIDNATPRSLEPVEVKPGKHKIVLQAPGYFPEERELFAADKQMTALDVPLRPIPAKITIAGRPGSTVTVDGAPRGILPFAGPIEVEAGQRNIIVSQSGFVTFAKDYDLGRGKELSITADLSRTRQRILSGIMFGTGITFAGFGVLATLSAAGSFGEAAKIGLRWDNGETITAQELKDYNDYNTAQSEATVASTILFNLGAASAALGFLLYYFDDPKLPQVKPKKDDTTPKKDTPGMRDMMFAPVTGPGYGGFAFSARF